MQNERDGILTGGGVASFRPVPTSVYAAGVAIGLAVAGLLLVRGPHLGDHEVIVAQTARQILQDGNWVIPRYLDTPFLVKSPLPAWLVAGVSIFFGKDPATGLPVTDLTARLPSMLAMILTVFVVHRLARSMYPRPIAHLAGYVAATSLGLLLFAVNATAEALLVLFCTWAFAEFWWSRQAADAGRARFHMLRFYLALGLAMLAKGPMPMPMVALPIAFWWWADRGLRLVALGGPRSIGRVVRFSAADFLPRLRRAVTDLGLWWGVPVFLLMFLPWMIAVARQEPYAWRLWEYEFLDRARGKYPGCHWGELHYYIPILFGLMLPWALSVPEALAAPFLRAHVAYRKPLVYAWCWVVIPFLWASAMSFKKSYYILPVLPGCVLLLAPVLHRFFFETVIRDRRRAVFAVAGILLVVGLIPGVGYFTLGRMYPEEWHGTIPVIGVVLCVLALGGLGLAAWSFVNARRQVSFFAVGASGFATFATAWCLMGPALGNYDDPLELVEKLRQAPVSKEADLYWASNRPDGRVLFYAGQPLKQVLDPYKLIAEHHEKASGDDLRMMVALDIIALLKGRVPVCLVMQREDFELLTSYFNPPARALFSVDRGAIGEDEDDWVVFTNEGAHAASFAETVHGADLPG